MKLTQITLRAGAALCCAILFAAPLQAKQATAKAAKPTSMFVVSGATATIQHHDGGYILKMPLNNIKQMLTFTEQPFRLVKYVKPQGLKQIWSGKTVVNNFAGNPPNAVLSTQQGYPAVVILKFMAIHGSQIDFLFHPIKPGMFHLPTGLVHQVALTIDGASQSGMATDADEDSGDQFLAYRAAGSGTEATEPLSEAAQNYQAAKAAIYREADAAQINADPSADDYYDVLEDSANKMTDQLNKLKNNTSDDVLREVGETPPNRDSASQSSDEQGASSGEQGASSSEEEASDASETSTSATQTGQGAEAIDEGVNSAADAGQQIARVTGEAGDLAGDAAATSASSASAASELTEVVGGLA